MLPKNLCGKKSVEKNAVGHNPVVKNNLTATRFVSDSWTWQNKITKSTYVQRQQETKAINYLADQNFAQKIPLGSSDTCKYALVEDLLKILV